MTAVALKGLAGRKFRAILTAIAIVLGVAMVSGTYVLTDTIDKAFADIFVRSYAGTDAIVTGRGADISFQGDSAETPPIPAAVLAQVRQVDGVEAAIGSVTDESDVKLLQKGSPKAIETSGAPSLSVGVDPEESDFSPLDLRDGRWAAGPGEVVIDVGTADGEGYSVGDRIGVASLGPVEQFRIVGLAQFGGSTLGSATVAAFDVPTLQRLLRKEGRFDGIQVAAASGVSQDELVRRLDETLPASLEVATGTDQATEDAGDITEFTAFIRYFLLAFAGIALFVGAFVIFNTLSITVAQRAREFATLRTIGASRRQVLTSVVLEALVIGVLASLVGLFSGLALAKGLNSLFKALELDLPTTGLVFAGRTIVVSLLIGIGITLLAGLFPAIRATRVPPISAVREGAVLPTSRYSRVTPIFALVVLGTALGLLGFAMFADDLATGTRLLSIAAGVLGLFVGVAMIASKLVRPLAAVVGWPSTRIGGAVGVLARGNALRNPGRTAATAAALMIGLALVTFVSVLADGMRASNREAIEDQIRADYIVTSQDGYTPFVKTAGDAVSRSEAADVATSVRSELGQVNGTDKYVTGIDPRLITQGYSFDWKDGSDEVLASLGRTGAIIDEDFAEDEQLAVGSRFPLLTTSGQRLQLEVKGIYTPPPFYPLLGSVSIPTATFDSVYDRPRNQYTFINVAGDPSDAAKRQLEAAALSFPDAKVQTRDEWVDKEDKEFSQFLLLLYVLLALSVIVSLFGMVNTLVLSVFERTRELGMLRAVGMTRRQTRRLIRHESVITALIGAALGLPLGIFLAAMVTRALAEFDIRFSIPIVLLIIFTVVAILAGLLAAILPARRASRLNVLNALQYE